MYMLNDFVKCLTERNILDRNGEFQHRSNFFFSVNEIQINERLCLVLRKVDFYQQKIGRSIG